MLYSVSLVIKPKTINMFFFRYVDMIGLTDPSDSIDFVMRQLAVKLQRPRSGNGHGALLG